MGYGVVFKKTHLVWGFEKVMKIIGGGGGGLDEKKIIGGGGSEIVGIPPPSPMYF